MSVNPAVEARPPAPASRDERVAGVTLVVGTSLLRLALTSPKGGSTFRRRTLALAATWVVGAAATGQLTRSRWAVADREDLVDRVVRPAAVAAAAAAVFTVGAVVVSTVPVLRREIDGVVDHARRGSLPTVAALALVAGAAEETFFRGTLHDLAERRGIDPLAVTVGVHAAATCATGNPLLVFASTVLGVLTGQERRRTGSLLAPTVVHLGWSLAMIEVLPRITARRRDRES